MGKLNIGMDVGTTNSAIAIAESEFKTVILDIPNSKGGILPSCVKYISRDKVIVGVPAYTERYKPSVIYSMKRHMEEGEAYKEKVIAEDGSEFEVDPIEVTSHVIRAMLDGLESTYGKDCYDKVTITVPAYFSEIARYNTVLAGVKAGLEEENITLINEPTSAALSYGLTDTQTLETVLVYDFGGGTFDATLVDIAQGADGPEYNVITSGGDSRLGGDDIDREITSILLDKLAVKLEEMTDDMCTITADDELREKIILFAEKAKKSTSELTNMAMPITITEEMLDQESVVKLMEKGVTFPIEETLLLNYQDLEDAVHIIAERVDKALEPVLVRADKNVSKMLLIGGSTKSLILQKYLRSKYSSMSIKSYTDPDKSVAEGASIYSAMRSKGSDSRLNDIIQIPIGIKLADADNPKKEYVKHIIAQDLHLPVSASETCSTAIDNQQEVVLEVYQGKSRFVNECVKIGEIVISDIPPAKVGYYKFKVTLNVNVSGTLSLTINQYTVDGAESNVYQKELRRLSSNSTKANGESQEALDKLKKNKIYQRRVTLIHQTVDNETGLEMALKDFEEASLKGESFVKEFFDDIQKYNKVEKAGGLDDKDGNGPTSYFA